MADGGAGDGRGAHLGQGSSGSNGAPGAPSSGPRVALTPDEAVHALRVLKPVFDEQQRAAHLLQKIFEMCVARGLFRPEEYFERLKNTPD